MGVTTVDLTESPGKARSSASATDPRATGSSWVRDLRHLPDSLLHRRRRHKAQVQLRNLKPRAILFVCSGNICRSPFAAAAFARLCVPRISGGVTATSAGLIGPARVPPTKAVAAGLRRGIDISAHRSALVTNESLQGADLVVVMSVDQARAVRARLGSGSPRVVLLGDLDPSPIARRTIADPWGGSNLAFDASYDRIDRCVRELVQTIGDAG